jgi:hypothetical protein
MTQFEQENDLGRGGGQVDDETLEEAWRESDRRHDQSVADAEREGADEQPQPWAKASPSTESVAADEEG